MPAQSRRPISRPSRAQRRAGASEGARTYTTPASRPTAYVPRRSFAAEPAPIDYTAEFRYIRKDLVRILLWATLIIAVMIVLSFIL